jgi:hypothetical protein
MTMHLGSLDALTWSACSACSSAPSPSLGRKALVPVKDPRIAESVKFENF